MLSINIVYSNDKLNIILIDDSMHTMDDISMASFTEVMRNEFGDKQLIISTHEDNVSRYIRYKFKKYGIQPLRQGMKEE